MSNFSQWHKSFHEKGPRQITWVCGTSIVLIDEVVESIKHHLNPEPWNFSVFYVGELSENEIWNSLAEQPLDSGNRLVVIRKAENLQTPERLTNFAKSRTQNPRTSLIFVSGESDLPKTEVSTEDFKLGNKPETVPYLKNLGQKAHLVEAKPFTQATAKNAITWVRSKVKMTEQVAATLLNRANGDLRLVRDTCYKLSQFDEVITSSTVAQILAEVPRESFSEALLSFDKKTALLALSQIPPSQYSKWLGLLDAELDVAGRVHDMLIEHRTNAEIAQALGNQRFRTKELVEVAGRYSHTRRLEIREMLAVADEALQAGETIGVMETIVEFW